MPEHVTALSSGCPDSTEADVQVLPPSDDVAAIPPKFASPPTATQSSLVAHVTALKAPVPASAPPGVGTAGASTSSAGTVHEPV